MRCKAKIVAGSRCSHNASIGNLCLMHFKMVRFGQPKKRKTLEIIDDWKEEEKRMLFENKFLIRSNKILGGEEMKDNLLLEQNAHISTSEIWVDIADTKREIEELKAKKILQPKLSTSYNSHIAEREKFILALERILRLRGK